MTPFVLGYDNVDWVGYPSDRQSMSRYYSDHRRIRNGMWLLNQAMGGMLHIAVATCDL